MSFWYFSVVLVNATVMITNSLYSVEFLEKETEMLIESNGIEFNEKIRVQGNIVQCIQGCI